MFMHKSIKEYSITEDTTTNLVSFGDEVTRVSLVAEPVDDNLLFTHITKILTKVNIMFLTQLISHLKK